MKKDKFKVGTKVIVKKSYIKWERSLLPELYGLRPGGLEITPYISEVVMWLGADIDTPRGQVIAGKVAFPEEDVRIRVRNYYGEAELIINKRELIRLVKKGKKRA